MLYVQAGSPWCTVKAWQAFLNHQLGATMATDGLWGAHTVEVTKNWQAKNHLTADGKIGPGTYRLAQGEGFEIPPITVPTGNSNTVIDLSHHNGVVNLEEAKSDGVLAVFNKATQGTWMQDTSYRQNRKLAEEAGLLWGAYHFGELGNGAIQAAYFWDFAEPNDQAVLALDYEANRHKDGSVHNSIDIPTAVEFIQWILQKSGRYPLLYGGSKLRLDYARADAADQAVLRNCPLWIAGYTSPSHLLLPGGWDQYTFWQYTDNGIVKGIPGGCDADFFNGSPEQLKQFWLDPAVAK